MKAFRLKLGMLFTYSGHNSGSRIGSARLSLLVLAAWVLACSSGAQAGPHDVFGGLVGAVNQAHSGAVNTDESEEQDTANACATTASACYASDVEPVVQQNCTVCHQQGLTADQQGARLLFTDDPASNHAALESFVTTEGVGADWLLGKIIGDLGHGGGSVLAKGGDSYYAFADYLTLLIGANTDDGSVDASSIWSGTVIESPETTLRRAGILLAGKVPSDEAIKRAQSLKYGLKSELIALMEGEGFHDFITTGANDRLLTDGLKNGIDFQFDTWRFPVFREFELSLPSERPEKFDTEAYWDRPFLTQGEANQEFRNALIREPLELIAYIVENDRPYTEVVTANYTVVNQFSALAYKADVTFDTPLHDKDGFFDRRLLNTFIAAENMGHIPSIENNVIEDATGEYSISEYHDWPHAGVLTTPAWLNRYPSTDTNRNRARARWTYYQFLGVDIEKSAPRTTDPVALADTNNPTMYNPACTVCHESLDPVAGAYQGFGDRGNYLDQWGGMDSLPESYKQPEAPVGEVHELVHDVSVSDTYKVSKRRLSARVANDGGRFTINDISPRGCIQDQNNEDNWWCSYIGIKRVTVLKGGFIRRRINAHEFESDDRFSVDSWVDEETGESHPNGWLDDNVYFIHTNAWMAFNFELSPGDYELEVELVSKMAEAHPEPSITVSLAWTDGFNRSEGYQFGDTWYRDMRSPGFNGKTANGNQDSIQWLGQRIAQDPRFSKATVKFWWPSVFGTEVLVAPADRSLPNYEANLLAFNAQEALVEELAAAFAADGFKLKSLLADMVLSRWFRTAGVEGSLTEIQEVALEFVGRGRQLTPEELDRKNRAVFGRTWGQSWGGHAYDYRTQTNFTGGRGYGAFYGGIDGASITKRNREQTPLMSNVVERMAVDLACQVVLDDFSKPRETRTLFTEVDKTSDPMRLAGEEYELNQGGSQGEYHYHDHSLDFSVGDSEVVIQFSGPEADNCRQDEANSTEDHWVGWCRRVGVIAVSLYKSGRLIETLEAENFSDSEAFQPKFMTDNETGEVYLQGDFYDVGSGDMAFFPWWGNATPAGGGFSFGFDLDPGDYSLKVRLISMVDEGYPREESHTVSINARSHTPDPSSPDAKAVANQLDVLYLRATGHILSDEQRSSLLAAFSARVLSSQEENAGHCDTWSLRDNSDPQSHEENHRLFGSPTGAMHAWTLMLHTLMTSYPYLYD